MNTHLTFSVVAIGQFQNGRPKRGSHAHPEGSAQPANGNFPPIAAIGAAVNVPIVEQPSRTAEELPVWPARLTRDQQRTVKQRKKEFELALKELGRSRGWRYAGGGLFRQDGDWFACTFPWLSWERGALMHFTLKPMTLDPLFWEIVGLPENNRLPLSFRANGAWVLRPPSQEIVVGIEERNPTRLARMTVDAADSELAQSRQCRSVERMLAQINKDAWRAGQPQAVLICLNILAGDLDAALALCRSEQGPSSGGFITGNVSFLDQAREWIVAKRRKSITSV